MAKVARTARKSNRSWKTSQKNILISISVWLEVWYNQSNQQVYTQVNAQAGISTPPGVPEIVIGKTVLVGDKDIPTKLEGYLQAIEKKK